MEKHYRQIVLSAFISKKLIILLILGCMLLVLSMYINILAFNVTIGIVTWFGIAKFITGLMIYLFLSLKVGEKNITCYDCIDMRFI